MPRYSPGMGVRGFPLTSALVLHCTFLFALTMQCCLASVQQKGEVTKERRTKNVRDEGARFRERS